MSLLDLVIVGEVAKLRRGGDGAAVTMQAGARRRKRTVCVLQAAGKRKSMQWWRSRAKLARCGSCSAIQPAHAHAHAPASRSPRDPMTHSHRGHACTWRGHQHHLIVQCTICMFTSLCRTAGAARASMYSGAFSGASSWTRRASLAANRGNEGQQKKGDRP